MLRHAPWSGITGKPATFPPDAHDHDDRYFTETELNTSGAGGAVHWDNVTNKPALGGGGDMTKAAYDQNNDGVVDAAETVPWSGITGKPAIFPPDAHTHSDIVQDQIAAASYMDALGLMSSGGDILPILLNGTNALKKTSLDDIGEVLAFNNYNARYARVTHNHDHRTLSYVGSNTHEAIDQHISSPAPHTGHAYTNHWHETRQVLVHHVNSATIAAGGTSYIVLSIPGYTGLNGVVWPLAGYMLNLTVRTNSAQPSTGSLVFTLQKGLIDTPVVATVPASAGASTQWTSGTKSQCFVANELLSIKVKNNATAASCQITTVSWEFRPSTV